MHMFLMWGASSLEQQTRVVGFGGFGGGKRRPRPLAPKKHWEGEGGRFIEEEQAEEESVSDIELNY